MSDGRPHWYRRRRTPTHEEQDVIDMHERIQAAERERDSANAKTEPYELRLAGWL